MPLLAIGLVLIGLIAGVAAGMFGIGGGVIIVPALILLLGFDQHAASGTSLVALLSPVSLFAVLAYYRAGKLNMKVALVMAAGLWVGGYFGGMVANSLPSDDLRRAYGLFLLFVAWRFAEPGKWLAELRGQTIPKPPEDSIGEANPSLLVMIGIGAVAGVLAGLFGIGGGVIIVPALVALVKFDHKRAVATSLAALLPPNIPAILPYLQSGNLDIGVGLLVALGLVGGAFVGARIALGLPSQTIKRAYAVFLVLVSIRFIFFG
jgi:uncharacterized membrane protein YfcA